MQAKDDAGGVRNPREERRGREIVTDHIRRNRRSPEDGRPNVSPVLVLCGSGAVAGRTEMAINRV